MVDLVTELRRLRILPVIVIDEPRDAIPLAHALLDGGLPCAEITFRTPRADEALRVIARECPSILVGAGTVLTVEQAARACDAGARFIVTPGFNPEVADFCLEKGIALFPGVCTPTEVDAALRRGLNVLKFFPAEAMGGASLLKAISAPYSMVEFIPTGGINLTNLAAYLSLGNVVACGGSWLVSREWVRTGDFGRIRKETELAVQAARQFTGGV
jgi:2-dehydro-3-deoxyphosphogluconate aldolase/(4S)-4-hydroxy-2-oxoglutarate aldolase